MEEENLYGYITKQLDIKQLDVLTVSPLTLAFIGDAVYELIIRSYVITTNNKQINQLNKLSSNFAKASTQAVIVRNLQVNSVLSDEEVAVFKRGRNAKSQTSAKNASITDYRAATGFESLIGYLYLTGKMDRVYEIVSNGIELIGE